MPARSMTKGGIDGVGCLHPAVSGGAGEIYGNGGKLAALKEEVVGSIKGSAKRPPCLRDSYGFDDESPPSPSSSSSSIGKNSDLSDKSNAKSVNDEEEVQSSYKGPLDAMEALEQVLPMRRGISSFYSGKSKSFASLADASSSPSSASLAKPENAYARKRRNLLACSLAYDKGRTSPLRGNNGGGISKRANNTSKKNLALAVAMTNRASSAEEDKLPLMATAPPAKAFPSCWRSFSMVDLQQN